VAGTQRRTSLPRNDGVAHGRARRNDALLHTSAPGRRGDRDGQGHLALRPFAFDVAREYPFARTGHDLSRVIDRSQLAPIVAGIGTTQKPLGTTSAFTLKCETHGQYKFTVNLYSRRPEASRRTCAPAPRLHFPCPALRCDGVYPIRIEVTTNATTTMQWSLLAVQSTPVEEPLRVELVETMDPNAWIHAKRSIAVLHLLARHPSSAISLSADYRTLDTVAQPGSLNTLFHTHCARRSSVPCTRRSTRHRRTSTSAAWRPTASATRCDNNSVSRRPS